MTGATMKSLSGKRVYLSGPIEYDTSGHDWRPEVKLQLLTRFNLQVFDPFVDPKQSRADELDEAKAQDDYDKVAEIAADFVSKDLIEVDNANLLIANLPYKVPTVGTIHEIVNAVNRKIPTLIVCSSGKRCIPSWLYGVLKKKHKFYLHGSWESLYTYLEEVDNKKHVEDRRWRYVYGML
jgi:nucleoside 2-deoxyribosyltransferase